MILASLSHPFLHTCYHEDIKSVYYRFSLLLNGYFPLCFRQLPRESPRFPHQLWLLQLAPVGRVACWFAGRGHIFSSDMRLLTVNHSHSSPLFCVRTDVFVGCVDVMTSREDAVIISVKLKHSYIFCIKLMFLRSSVLSLL